MLPEQAAAACCPGLAFPGRQKDGLHRVVGDYCGRDWKALESE